MRTLIPALAAAATLSILGLAAPAFASDTAATRAAAVDKQATDFSSHGRHWRHRHHHHGWRHHYGWGGPRCHIVWRWGHPVRVCRW